MMSDVPFGVFLSGGLDSSTNVALMAELSDAPVRTYSTAPRGHARYDELAYARIVASRFATDHHEVLVDEPEMRDFLPELIFHQDEPLSDWTAIPQHFVTRLARETGTIVVQVGEGADELFHGYRGYVDHRRVVVPFQRWVPRPIRPADGRRGRAGDDARSGAASATARRSTTPATAAIPYWGGALCFRGPLKERLYVAAAPRRAADGRADLGRGRRPRGDADLFQSMSYLELRQRLPELLLAAPGPDRDGELGRGPRAVPRPRARRVRDGAPAADEVPRRAGQARAARGDARRAARRDHRPPQAGLRQPDGGVAARRLRPRRAAAVRGSALRERGLLDYDVVDRLFAAHAAGRGDWSKHLWNLYCVSRWYDRWIARRDA